MKILITGINGFIGSHFADRMAEDGHVICGIDRLVGNGKYPTDLFDITREDVGKYLSELKPDVIVNCAGQASVPNSISHPQDDLQENTIIVHKLLFGMQQAGLTNTRFIQLSSAAVYGNPVSLPIDENATVNPLSPYALHKKMAEDVCLFFSDNCNVDVKILRIFSVYGCGLRKQILWDLYQKYLNTGKLTLLGTGNESRDYIHIDDLVEVMKIATISGNKEKIWNVASGIETYIKDVAQIYAKNLGLNESNVLFDGKVRAGDPLNWCADISRIKGEGFKPLKNISDGIAEYIEWIKNVN